MVPLSLLNIQSPRKHTTGNSWSLSGPLPLPWTMVVAATVVLVFCRMIRFCGYFFASLSHNLKYWLHAFGFQALNTKEVRHAGFINTCHIRQQTVSLLKGFYMGNSLCIGRLYDIQTSRKANIQYKLLIFNKLLSTPYALMNFLHVYFVLMLLHFGEEIEVQ